MKTYTTKEFAYLLNCNIDTIRRNKKQFLHCRIGNNLIFSWQHGELITINELAKMLKITKRIILKNASENKIPSIKVGNMYKFIKKDIYTWLENKIAKERGI